MYEFMGLIVEEESVEELKTVEVKRCEHEADQANRGLVFYERDFIGFSLERPNLENKPFASRINPGTYYANKVYAESRGWFWLLENANGRTGIILFHPGNTRRDFKGCLGFGDSVGEIARERAIFNTKNMCSEFMDLTEDETRLRVIIT